MSATDQEALSNLQPKRVLVPVAIGLAVVGILFWKNFEPNALSQIIWNRTTLVFLACAVLFLAVRVVAYALRLKLLSGGEFSFRKSLQLIFIWEFSSAVSPTNVGGSAVALFVLAQEKLSASKTSTIVIYTIILDTLFVMVAIPLWYFIYGKNILGSANVSESSFGGWEATLLTAYGVMVSYGLFLFYALMRKPEIFAWLARGVARVPLLRRFREQLIALGSDIKRASEELFTKDIWFHSKALLLTMVAWSARFLLIICLLAGFVQMIEWEDVLPLFARIQTMFVLIAFSPTPGGSGLAELLFGTLLSDQVPSAIGVIVATIWRALAYYFFLLMGVLVIPGWLNSIFRKRTESPQNADS